MVTCRSLEGWSGFRCRTSKWFSGPRASLYRFREFADRFFIVHRVKAFDFEKDLETALADGSLDYFDWFLCCAAWPVNFKPCGPVTGPRRGNNHESKPGYYA